MKNNDNPDTFPESEQTRWLETLAEDVFLPTVRVQLNWRDVEAAVSQGAIVPQQAHALWANWAMPGSNTRMGADGIVGARSEANGNGNGNSFESSWVDRPMPEIQRNDRTAPVVTFVLGAVVGMAAIWAYSYFMAG